MVLRSIAPKYLLTVAVYVGLVAAQLRNIPVAPDYDKPATKYIPADNQLYHPNFVVQNFAGTRDARYIPNDGYNQSAKILRNNGFNESWMDTTNPYISISGGQNVSANEAKFSGVYGLSGYNETGDVFVSDYCIIRRISAEGVITVYAGSYIQTIRDTYYDDIFLQEMGNSCGFEDNVDALEGLLSFPFGLATDTSGNLYIADTENLRIRKVDRATNVLSTIAGNGTTGLDLFTSVDEPATDVFIDYPVSITVGGQYLYFVYQRTGLAAVDLSTGLLYRWLPAGLQVPQYGSLWVDVGRNILYYAGKTAFGNGLVLFNLSAPGRNGDTPLQWYATITTQEDYSVHAVTGDQYGNLYWASSADEILPNSARRKCRLSFFHIEEAKEYIIAGDDYCGFPTVGAASLQSRILPAFNLYLHRDGSLLFAQTNLYVQDSAFVDQDSPFFYAGVMQLALTQPTSQPTSMPSGQPSMKPSSQPSSMPSASPTSQPSGSPSAQPSSMPSSSPTSQPTNGPTAQPTNFPSSQPTGVPSAQPTGSPSSQPSAQPTSGPTSQPTSTPTTQPSSSPSSQPTGRPTGQPSFRPSGQPTGSPTSQPSSRPSGQPSGSPTRQPTGQPSARPSTQPTGQPTYQPTNAQITLTRGEITGAVVGSIIGFVIVSTLLYYLISYYRGLHWIYTGPQ